MDTSVGEKFFPEATFLQGFRLAFARAFATVRLRSDSVTRAAHHLRPWPKAGGYGFGAALFSRSITALVRSAPGADQTTDVSELRTSWMF